ncbi:MAG: aminoacyl-histidine dipeptidase [Ruminococcaceae bacterium]|nr:aminoacyl-histidine dipeptidase [Oscillospiraceae bacterium]
MICENFLYPKLIKFFEEISAIPRASYHEEKISEYLVNFAKARGLEYYCDKVGNVLINMPASKGRENESPILFQGHTDMVCEKNEGIEHDFSKDPLKLYEKDGWLKAEGTTLGADNGVAVAVMLALLDGAAESHRAIQCLFTVSEEVGLDGAKAFDYSRIYARKMINMDSADEELIIAGCAGGLRTNLDIPITRETAHGTTLKIGIKGLFGGHSGEDIHRGRANANKLMGRVLAACLSEHDGLRLVSVSGGTKENAIPRESESVIVCKDAEAVEKTVNKISGEIKDELCADDKAFNLAVKQIVSCDRAMTAESTEKVIFFMSTVSNGVFERSAELSGIVEYSRNLGVVSTYEDKFEALLNTRSARDSQIDCSIREIDFYAKMLSGSSNHYNRYPGWVYAESSEIREEYAEAYKALFGKMPTVEVIHAGLECGIIKAAIPDMDMISCGPVVVNLHSPDEALNIASFERFFNIILTLV